jgi:hypothetical protein
MRHVAERHACKNVPGIAEHLSERLVDLDVPTIRSRADNPHRRRPERSVKHPLPEPDLGLKLPHSRDVTRDCYTADHIAHLVSELADLDHEPRRPVGRVKLNGVLLAIQRRPIQRLIDRPPVRRHGVGAESSLQVLRRIPMLVQRSPRSQHITKIAIKHQHRPTRQRPQSVKRDRRQTQWRVLPRARVTVP